MAHMKAPQKYTVWIVDAAAREFLGKDPAPADAKFNTRWFISGTYLEDEPPAGFWMRVEYVAQWSATGAITAWHVRPPECFIAWRSIITIQYGGELQGRTLEFVN